ncbi:MAG: hypothetical protein DRJ35_02925 [Thermoprotei archaeon]|nr:MAG: hypothetical protein DRJ35_02925 [Thermoprotei archaeon]
MKRVIRYLWITHDGIVNELSEAEWRKAFLSNLNSGKRLLVKFSINPRGKFMWFTINKGDAVICMNQRQIHALLEALEVGP